MVDQITDAEYLKGNDLGMVIAKGMAVMYKAEPKNPVDFLAKWLLNYSKVERVAEDRAESLAVVEQQKKQHAERRAQLNTEQAERQMKQDAVENKKTAF